MKRFTARIRRISASIAAHRERSIHQGASSALIITTILSIVVVGRTRSLVRTACSATDVDIALRVPGTIARAQHAVPEMPLALWTSHIGF
jgi:hypothetical protein